LPDSRIIAATEGIEVRALKHPELDRDAATNPRGMDQWIGARLLNARDSVRGKMKSLGSCHASGDTPAFMRAR
jgi:hypothetical protein